MPGLIEDGFAQKVLIATPTTLLGLLRDDELWLARGAPRRERAADQRRGAHAARPRRHGARTFRRPRRSLGQSVKHFNGAWCRSNGRVTVRRAGSRSSTRGVKGTRRSGQIDVRAALSPVADRERAKEPRAALPQTSLALALAPTNDEGASDLAVDFVEPARAFTLELVGGRGHYERVVRAAMEAKRSVWIATANLKELMVEDHRAAPGRRRTLRRARAPVDRPIARSWTCSTSSRRAASSCGCCTPGRRRARFARRWRAARGSAARSRCAPARASTSRR